MRRRLAFLTRGRLQDMPLWQRSLATGWRIFAGSIASFRRDQGGLRTAGLTYWTLMAMVPVLAVVFAIAGTFGLKGRLIEWVREIVKTYPERFKEVLETLLSLVDRVDLGALSAVAILGLVLAVFSVLSRIETAFNVTWKASRARNLARKYADYIAILFLIPVLVLASTGLNTALHLESAIASLHDVAPWLAALVRSGMSFVPFLLLWLAFTLLLKIVPNARVAWFPVVLSGFVTSVVFLVMQRVYLESQIGLTQANAIYGTLAFLPLFLVYLQLAWTVVLWGAELCYAIQYREQVLVPRRESAWSPDLRRRVGFFVVREAVRCFKDGASLSIAEAASRFDLPRRRIDEVVGLLVHAGVLHRVRSGSAIVPARPPGENALQALFAALDGEGEPAASELLAPEERELLDSLRKQVTEVEGEL